LFHHSAGCPSIKIDSLVKIGRGKKRVRSILRRTELWILIKGYSFLVYKTNLGFIINSNLRNTLYVAEGTTLHETVNNLLVHFFQDYHAYSTFQGTRVMTSAKSLYTPPMIAAYKRYGQVIINNGADYQLPVMVPVEDDEEVKSFVEETVEKHGLTHLYDKGIRTDELDPTKDPDHAERIARGYLINVAEDCDKDYYQDDDLDFVLLMNLLDMQHGEEGMWENEVVEPDVVEVAKVAVQPSSTGYFCEDSCNKKQNSVDVAIDLSLQSEEPPESVAFAPAMSLRKVEVIKDHSEPTEEDGEIEYKKGRVIQSVDPAIAKASDCIFSSYRMKTGLAGGEIIGEPFNGSFGANFVERITGGDDEKFIEDGFHESDVKGWEGSTKEDTAFIFCFALILAAANFSAWGGVPAACLAHYYMPLIALGGPYVGARVGIVCSGSPFTAKGNTVRHRLMIWKFIAFVEYHGGFAGLPGCKCDMCAYAAAHGFELGRYIPESCLMALRRAVLMGDDFAAVWTFVSRIFDEFRDKFSGTTTKTEHKAWDEGEICKRRLIKVNGAYSTRKVASKVVMKLKGPRGHQATNKMAAAVTHACDANDETVYGLMKDIYEGINEKYSAVGVEDELADSYKGTRQMKAFPSFPLVRSMHQPSPRQIHRYELDRLTILRTGRRV